MSSFHIFFLGVGSGEGACPSPDYNNKVKDQVNAFLKCRCRLLGARIVHENSEHVFIVNRLYLSSSVILLAQWYFLLHSILSSTVART